MYTEVRTNLCLENLTLFKTKTTKDVGEKMVLYINKMTMIVCKLDFFFQLIEKHPCEGSRGKASQVSPTLDADGVRRRGCSSILSWVGAFLMTFPSSAAWHYSFPPYISHLAPPCTLCMESQQERAPTAVGGGVEGSQFCKVFMTHH